VLKNAFYAQLALIDGRIAFATTGHWLAFGIQSNLN
jgi:hypothetical protein